VTKNIKNDTTHLREDTAAIKNDTTEILQEIARLRAQLPDEQATLRPSTKDSDSTLARYLDDLTSYAETVCWSGEDSDTDDEQNEAKPPPDFTSANPTKLTPSLPPMLKKPSRGVTTPSNINSPTAQAITAQAIREQPKRSEDATLPIVQNELSHQHDEWWNTRLPRLTRPVRVSSVAPLELARLEALPSRPVTTPPRPDLSSNTQHATTNMAAPLPPVPESVALPELFTVSEQTALPLEIMNLNSDRPRRRPLAISPPQPVPVFVEPPPSPTQTPSTCMDHSQEILNFGTRSGEHTLAESAEILQGRAKSRGLDTTNTSTDSQISRSEMLGSSSRPRSNVTANISPKIMVEERTQTSVRQRNLGQQQHATGPAGADAGQLATNVTEMATRSRQELHRPLSDHTVSRDASPQPDDRQCTGNLLSKVSNPSGQSSSKQKSTVDIAGKSAEGHSAQSKLKQYSISANDVNTPITDPTEWSSLGVLSYFAIRTTRQVHTRSGEIVRASFLFDTRSLNVF